MLKSLRRFSLFLALPAALAVLLALSGCVYLRLLQLKEQLKNFDRNFAVSGDKIMGVNFHNPLLYGADMRFLIGAGPLGKMQEGDARGWRYEFEMARHTPVGEECPLERLALVLWFNADFKLVKLEVPENFLALFPRDVFLESLRQAAGAEVLELQRTARGRFRLSSSADPQLPTREKAERLLGPPLAVQPEGREWEALIYRYGIRGASRPVPIIARLSFDGRGRLHRVRVTWGKSTVDVEYLRP